MCVDTGKDAAWPNKFGHGTRNSTLSATATITETPQRRSVLEKVLTFPPEEPLQTTNLSQVADPTVA
jgi:hypothetical protein